MQLKAIETFLCVAETGGFHAAARKLNVTQTAVSARIRLIEEAAGKQLFTRGAGGTALTDYGREFKPYAEQMVSLWSFASKDLPTQARHRPALRLGAQLSIWDPLLVDIAVRFEQRFGQLMLTLNYDHDLDVVDAVATHVLDVALTHETLSDRRVVFHELAAERLVLVEKPEEPQTDGASVFVNLELGDIYQDHVRFTARQAKAQTIFLGNCMMALRYVLMRGGRGYFPTYLVGEDLAAGALVEVAGARDLVVPLYVVSRPDSTTAADVVKCVTDLRS